MYCPNCSSKSSTDQKFCRSCGMELQAVANLVAAQTGIARPDQPKESYFQGRRRAMFISGLILMFGGVAVGSSLKVLGKEHIQVAGDFTPYLMVITLLIVFFGMGLICYPFLNMTSPNRRSPLPASPKPEPTDRLESRLLTEEPSSVTEQTTEFLEASPVLTQVRHTAPHTE